MIVAATALLGAFGWVAITATVWVKLQGRVTAVEERSSILWTAYLQAALDRRYPIVARPGTEEPHG